MLIEIFCEKLRDKKIRFSQSLNVILGDDNATNSIGKSSLLMVIDFAFGGRSLLEHNTDIIEELGDHDYFFTFKFDGEDYVFRRGTYRPDLVYKCDKDYGVLDPIDNTEYTAFLNAAYAIDAEDISFRTLIGLYSRVWGKDNLNVYKPLHIVQTQSPKECVNNLIKTFGKYDSIRDLVDRLKKAEDKRSALSSAFRRQIIPKISKRKYQSNETRIDEIEDEIQDIKVNLARYATNLAEIANREILDLKVQKDALLDSKLQLDSKLLRTERNIAENRHIKSRHFSSLKDFFPQIDESRLVAIEEFHSGLAKVLRSELREEKRSLQDQISRIDAEIKSIDQRMAETLNSLDNPSLVVDRVYEISKELQETKEANQNFELNEELGESISSYRAKLSEEKSLVIAGIEDQLNDQINRIVTDVFGPDRKSPIIQLTESNYSYEVFEDTGTGTAYTSLLVLDLAVFSITSLPSISHDTLLYKNIENDSVANLLKVYCDSPKQSFIAIDEADKYGVEAAELLRNRCVVQLTNDHVLYEKDWRS